MPIPTGISGSRAAAILGLSKYATPFSVWQDLMEQRHGEGWNVKQGYTYEPFDGNTATEFGHAFEDSIVKLTEQKTGLNIIDREAVYNDGEFTTCHIDGRIGDDLYRDLFEGKHCNFRVFGLDWGEPGTDRVPTAIQCQVQHNMMLTGLEAAIVSVLVIPKTVQDFEAEGWQAHYDNLNGVHFLKNHETDQIIDPLTWAQTFAEIGNFHTYNIEARPDTQKLLKEMYSDFWHNYVLTGVAPDAVDYDDIRRQFTEPKGTLVISASDRIGGEDIADIMREYKNITKEIGDSGHLAKRKKFIKTQVLKFAREQTTVEDDESAERVLFLDESGKRLGSFNKKGFRS
jgi:hypothetical protein